MIYEMNGNTCPDIYTSFSTLKVACNVTKKLWKVNKSIKKFVPYFSVAVQ